jgi:glycosyltransferase involved in cell wall biosynthesis
LRIALIVTTFEREDALACVLRSARGQRRLPDELVVADDGSGPATREVVADCARQAGFPVIHAWQPHEGWRLCRSRNQAVARVDSDYIVVVDGDMLLDPWFLADHEAHARPGYWVQGCRLPLDAAATARALSAQDGDFAPRVRDTDLRHRFQACRLPRTSRLVSRPAGALLAVKGCNQAFWRQDLLRVNGWDESITGWGPEDKELCARLAHAGVGRRSLLFGALAWHLQHPPATRSAAATGHAALARTRAERRGRCERGLDAHGGRNPGAV